MTARRSRPTTGSCAEMAAERELTTSDLAGAADESRAGARPEPDAADVGDGRQTARRARRRPPPQTATADETREPLLPSDQSERFTTRWQEIQAGFVDEPQQSVEQADALVADLMQRLAAIFSQEREQLEAQWAQGDDVSTEDLRVALMRYGRSSTACSSRRAGPRCGGATAGRSPRPAVPPQMRAWPRLRRHRVASPRVAGRPEVRRNVGRAGRSGSAGVAGRVVASAEAGAQVCVVVSAMGDTTDELAELAAEVSPNPHPRERDMLLTAGEQISIALLSMAINDLGREAVSFTGLQAGIHHRHHPRQGANRGDALRPRARGARRRPDRDRRRLPGRLLHAAT